MHSPATNYSIRISCLASICAIGLLVLPAIAQDELRPRLDRRAPDIGGGVAARDSVRARPAPRREARDRGEAHVNGLLAPDLGIWFRRASGDLLIIDAVAGSGPIAQFGLHEGDRLISVNGQRVTTERDFLRVLLSDELRARRVPMVVIRDSRRQLLYVWPDVLIRDIAVAALDPLDRLGVVLDDRYVERIVIWRVLPKSPAYYAGLRPGDLITSFDGTRISDAGDLSRLIESAEGADIVMAVRRNQEDLDVTVDLRQAPAVAEAVLPPPLPRNETFDDIRPDPYSDRRLTPRPDVPPGMRIPGGEVGRERGPITPPTNNSTPSTPMRTGFAR